MCGVFLGLVDEVRSVIYLRWGRELTVITLFPTLSLGLPSCDPTGGLPPYPQSYRRRVRLWVDSGFLPPSKSSLPFSFWSIPSPTSDPHGPLCSLTPVNPW